jgi:hypothetical protein
LPIIINKIICDKPIKILDMELTKQQNKEIERIKAFVASDASDFILLGDAGTLGSFTPLCNVAALTAIFCYTCMAMLSY